MSGVFDETTALMDNMANLLQQCNNEIVDTYLKGIKYIGRAARIILQATGGMIANAKEFLFGVAGEVVSAIGEFIELASNVAATAMRTMRDFKSITLDLKQRTSNLEVPIPLPSAAKPSGNWQVREFNE